MSYELEMAIWVLFNSAMTFYFLGKIISWGVYKIASNFSEKDKITFQRKYNNKKISQYNLLGLMICISWAYMTYQLLQ